MSATAIVALLAASLALAGRSDDESASLTVLVHDYAGLSGPELLDVGDQVRLVLSRAGVSVRWIPCFGPGVSDECNGNVGRGRLAIRVLGRYPKDWKRHGDPLGSAEIEGFYASIYADEVGRMAAANSVAFTDLLAFAIVHEIGHLLLGPAHAPAGIMQPSWGKSICHDIARRWPGFSPVESDAIRRTLRGGTSELAGAR